MTQRVSQDEQLSDQAHFEVIVRRYQGALLRYARGSLAESDAQDAVQEVFMRLHKTMSKSGLRDITSVGTWLFRVAHNCVADVFRRKKIDDRTLEAVATDCADGSSVGCTGLEEAVHKEDCRLAVKLLDKLPDRERQIVLLKIDQGMSYRQISEVTSLALSTVGYLMNQGLDRLAKELKSAGVI